MKHIKGLVKYLNTHLSRHITKQNFSFLIFTQKKGGGWAGYGGGIYY